MGQTAAGSELDQKIEILETLQKLDDLLSQAQTGATLASGKPETGNTFGDYEIEQIVDLTKQLSETVNKALEPASAAKTGIDVAQAFIRLHEAALAAKTSSGAQKADQFAKLVSSWGGAAEALPWLIRGMSFNPMFTIYFFYLTKSLEALAYSIGAIEQYYETATGIWPSVLEPEYLDELADEAARQQQREDARAAMENELWQLKTERWINQRAVDRVNATAALQHCLRQMQDRYSEDFPVSVEGLEILEASVADLEAAAAVAMTQASHMAAGPAKDALVATATRHADDARTHRQRLAELYDCVDKTLQTYAAPVAVPAGAPEARPGVLATSWKYLAGGAVALLAVVGGYLGFGSDGQPLAAVPTTPVAEASEPSAHDATPSATPVATTSDALARFRAALPDGIAFAGEFGSDPCDVYDLTGRVEVAPSGAATITQTAGSADFQSNRGGTIGVGRYLVVWAAAAADAQYGEAWMVVVDLDVVDAGASLTDAVRILNVNGDVDSMVPNSEVEAAIAAFVAGLGEDGLATLVPEQFAEAMQAAPTACSGALRDETITQR